MQNQNIKTMPNYNSFRIINFKAIEDISIELTKHNLIALVGVNESGKTTLLEAVNIFANYNNSYGYNNKHKTGFDNHYITKIIASISIEKDKILEIVSSTIKEVKTDRARYKPYDPFLNNINNLESFNNIVKIKVFLLIDNSNNARPRYEINIFEFDKNKIIHKDKNKISNLVAKKIISIMPTIDYISNFQHDKYFNDIEILEENKSKSPLGICIKIVEEYNKKYNKKYSILEINENDRNKFSKGLSNYLNSEIIKFWKGWFKSKLDMSIKVEIFEEKKKNYIRFLIKESDGTEYAELSSFDLKDRFQGFIWFFNYILETRFSYKADNNGRRIFLLGESEAYLHPKTQENFCAQ